MRTAGSFRRARCARLHRPGHKDDRALNEGVEIAAIGKWISCFASDETFLRPCSALQFDSTDLPKTLTAISHVWP